MLFLGPLSLCAQSAVDTVLTAEDLRRLASFDEATALGVDPSGRLYVADGGQDVIVQLAPDGMVEERHGGPGVQPGAFDRPAAIDPSNGLMLYVADAGNARIQRFARSFQFLEALPVGPPSGVPVGPSYDSRDANPTERGTGTPVDVVVSPDDAVYVIDADHRQVLVWDDQRHTPHVIGGFNAGAGALADPVALALGPDQRLYVADRGRDAIVVFDAFGNYVTTYAEGRVAEAVSLQVVNDTLWLVSDRVIQSIDPSGRLGRRWTAALDEPLIDATWHAGFMYLLTAQRLYRTRRP
jgi:hypothetical protein